MSHCYHLSTECRITETGACGCLCEACLPTKQGAHALARIAELERERDEARTERDFFDAERVKVVAQFEAAEAALAAEKERLRKAEARAERLRKVALYFMRQGADGPWGWLRKSDLDAPKETHHKQEPCADRRCAVCWPKETP